MATGKTNAATGGLDKITYAKDVEVLAENEIKIGDTVYTVSGVQNIEGGEFYHSPLPSNVYTATFSPDGSTLVLGGAFAGRAKVYSVFGTTITYVSDIYTDAGTTPLSSIVYTATFSPDGSTLVLGGQFIGYAKVYSVSGTTITYVSDIYTDAGTTPSSSIVYTATFSPDGSTLVLGGAFTGRAKAYSVFGTTITYVSDIYADAGTTPLSGSTLTATFSPDGSALVLGGLFTDYAKVYSVSGTTITYVSDIYTDAGTMELSNAGRATAFSPDGNTLILGGNFDGCAKAYSVSGTTITYVSDIYADAGTTPLSSTVYMATFSPDGSTLVLGGAFTGRAKAYSVSGTTISYISNIYANAETTALSYETRAATFSPDGQTLVLGGVFSGFAKVYLVSDNRIEYVSNIYADIGTTALSNIVRAATFSPDGSTLVLGGEFIGYAKVYSVSGTTITYISNIYANNESAPLSNIVRAATFSPDGSTLVLGGTFAGRAKVYSVSGTTITYVSDIYTDAGTTPLSSAVYMATFSPDGSTLVLGGAFTGRAKAYSVSGTTISYISDIYANVGTTALPGAANTATFSPDGSTLVLGGAFAGYAKVYSVSGTTITYVSDIYTDAGTTPLSSIVYTATFSPDGSALVLGGQFIGYAKVYSVSGTTITYVSDIYANDVLYALSTNAYIAVFFPDGSVLVLGGAFHDFAKVYLVSDNEIEYSPRVYSANKGIVPKGNYGVGYSMKNIKQRERGIVRQIAYRV